MRKPRKARESAEQKSEILLFCAKRELIGMTWPEIEKAGEAEFGDDFPTRNTWKAWKEMTQGVDPANWTPALAPNWCRGASVDDPSPEAMAELIKYMKLSGKNGSGYPLKWAWRDVADLAEERGWNWPPYHTIRRRWLAMDPAERLVAELGEERAEDRLRLHQPQHSIGLAAMDFVDGDAKEFGAKVVWPDGTEGCPWVVAFTDRASRKTVGWAVGKSENADVIEEALINMCETHGRPNELGYDHGAAANSRRIAGGQSVLIQRRTERGPEWDVPGVLKILGIRLNNKAVKAKKSNLQENVWSCQRHVENHPAFHGAQRPGPNDPDPVAGGSVPVAVFEQVLAQAFNCMNSDTENRVKDLQKGESREQAFERLLKDGARRVVTPLMRRRLGMIWRRKMVQPDGRIKFDGGLFGDHTTQSEMLRHAGKWVLVGFNPQDFNAPAMVCHWSDKKKRGRLILDELPSVVSTQYASAEGRRNAITEKRRKNALVRSYRLTNPNADVSALRAMLETRSDTRSPGRDLAATRVVELPTGGDFLPDASGHESNWVSHLNEERMKNLEEATARRQAERF